MRHEEKSTRSRSRANEQRREEGRLPRGERGTSSTTGESTGAPLALTEKDIVRFWSKVDKNGPLPDQSNPHYVGLDRCWVWTGGKLKQGYGRFWLGQKTQFAHRAAWEIVNGPIPKGEGYHGTVVMHRCDMKPCCNPTHLTVGSHSDNIADRDAKERQARGDCSGPRLHPERMARGERNGSRTKPERRPRGDAHRSSKLSEDRVAKIRKMYATGGITQEQLGLMFGVNQPHISRIIRRTLWAHSPPANQSEWI